MQYTRVAGPAKGTFFEEENPRISLVLGCATPKNFPSKYRLFSILLAEVP